MDTTILWCYKKGTAIERKTFLEEPITKTIKANFEDPNIQIPMVVAATELHL
jgi:hypothetical protein